LQKKIQKISENSHNFERKSLFTVVIHFSKLNGSALPWRKLIAD